MDILIDCQKVVRVDYTYLANEDGERILIVDFTSANEILTAWRDLDLGRRNYRYARGYSDTAPSAIILAWATADGQLVLSDVEPFWDGREELNAYDLNYLAGQLPEGMLDWGVAA